ncbi:MAG: serine/threonine protein kinase [Firmicutes bacterium]|nr:serine/threonine protein kinase [Bacillota bacterium]
MIDINTYAPLWGSWHVESLIGEGSFGKVYKVRKEEFGKTYYSAVKIISIPQSEADLRHMRGEGLDEASVRSYFQAFVSDILQEIDLMSQLRGNSNIVSFEDHKVIERTDGFGWDILIRMELLTSLSEHCMEKPMDEAEIVKLGIHICRALELCARTKTIHRDIKPDNIFVSAYGDYKLGDFGIARQIERTMTGLSKKGTYTYMAPEVFKGDEYGASVDFYSLGIVMYRLLNKNRTPFLPAFPAPIMPSDRDASLQRRMKGEALLPIPGVSDGLNDIILKACAFDRQKRFATATEMREALEAYAAGKPAVQVAISAVVPAPGPEPEKTETTIGAFEESPQDKTEMTVGAFEGEPQADKPVPTLKKSTNKALIAVLVVVVMVLAGAAVWLAVQGRPDDGGQTQSSSSSTTTTTTTEPPTEPVTAASMEELRDEMLQELVNYAKAARYTIVDSFGGSYQDTRTSGTITLDSLEVEKEREGIRKNVDEEIPDEFGWSPDEIVMLVRAGDEPNSIFVELASSRANPTPSQGDINYISIVDVSHGALTAGQPATITVTVEYRLDTFARGEVNLGFNTNSSSSYTLVDRQVVKQGSGTVELSATITPKKWSSVSFGAYVNLSPYPHGSSWNPYADDVSSLPLN